VVGPRETISIAGAPLRQAMFWVPSALCRQAADG
jgi:hypothetical protein